ncbi:hypothetical protein JL721_11653 [Aureococcus anophagefferens]|nr:hypothetical protein JL721_11653 [Aureococcus anophagefferens]
MISIGARCRIAGKNGAILRRGAALNSPKQCIVPGNAEVTVLELAEAEDGTPRARVSSSSGEGFLSRKLLKPAGGAAKPLRVLGLHGGGASAKVMDFQTTALRRELGDRATWDFLDGTRPWTSRVDPLLHAMFDGGPFYGWYGVDDDGDPDRDYNDKLFDESVNFTYSDVEAGVAFVERYIAERGPFDVICGFSQGTIITTLVTAAFLRRGDTPSWRGNVLVCGIPPAAKWRGCEAAARLPGGAPVRDVVAQRHVAETGYTAHLSGMYSDKFIHPRVQCDSGRYISIGDPYKETSHDLPKRWKEKQMMVPGKPGNAGGGYFGLMGRAFDYMPDKYYRDLLKREKRLIRGGKALDDRITQAHAKLAEERARGEDLRAAVGLDAPKHLYDVGRSRETKFDPKMHRDKFYNTHTAHKREMRRGPYRTASQDIGDGAPRQRRDAGDGR